jgi:hypothetical protein
LAARATLTTLALLALLTTLALLALLAALALLPGIGEIAPAVLELVRGAREVAVRGDRVACVAERLGQSVEGLLRRRVVALGEALGRVLEGLAGRATGLVGRRLELGQLLGQLLLLLVRHLVELRRGPEVVGRLLRSPSGFACSLPVAAARGRG